MSPAQQGVSGSLAHGEEVPLGKGAPGQRRGTCAGVPVLGQLVALATVALVGAVDVGALLAAALGLTFVHICGETGLWSGPSPPSPARAEVPAYLGPYLGEPLIPASLKGQWGMRGPEKGKEPTWGKQLGQAQGWSLLVGSRPAAWRRQPQIRLRSPPWGARRCSIESP